MYFYLTCRQVKDEKNLDVFLQNRGLDNWTKRIAINEETGITIKEACGMQREDVRGLVRSSECITTHIHELPGARTWIPENKGNVADRERHGGEQWREKLGR